MLPRISSEQRSGMGHQAEHVAAAVAMPAIARAEPLGFHCRRASAPSGADVAEDHLAGGLQGVERLGRVLVVALGVGDRHAQDLALAQLAGERQVGRARPAGGRRGTGSAGRGCARMAPGRRPASSRIWKPLQMPSTRPPASAWRLTAPITGDSAASAPARR